MRTDTRLRLLVTIAIATLLLLTAAPSSRAWDDEDEDDDAIPFGAAVIIIELTDNDIELQLFADAFDWERLEIFDPHDRKVFDAEARGRLSRQGGMSEMFWASEPSHYLEDEPNYDESVASFLRRWPAGRYEFEGTTGNGDEIAGRAILSHVLPALPEIVAPVSTTEDPPLVDPDSGLTIDRDPVTTRFVGDGPIEILEYQVIVDQVDPERDAPWVDGGTRRALVNLPPEVTHFTVSPEFLLPGSGYEFEILAIEAGGNSTIAVGEFETSD